jgi:hypothetical protein
MLQSSDITDDGGDGRGTHDSFYIFFIGWEWNIQRIT